MIFKYLSFGAYAVAGLYIIAFAFVGACLVGSSQPVSSCRDNMAGEIVYNTVSAFVQSDRTETYYQR